MRPLLFRVGLYSKKNYSFQQDAAHLHSSGVQCHSREIHEICLVVYTIILLKIPMSKTAWIIRHFILFKAFAFYSKQLHISRGLCLLYRSDKFNKQKWITAWATLGHFRSYSLQKHKNMQEEKCATVQDQTAKINVTHFRKEEEPVEKQSLFLMADGLCYTN